MTDKKIGWEEYDLATAKNLLPYLDKQSEPSPSHEIKEKEKDNSIYDLKTAEGLLSYLDRQSKPAPSQEIEEKPEQKEDSYSLETAKHLLTHLETYGKPSASQRIKQKLNRYNYIVKNKLNNSISRVKDNSIVQNIKESSRKINLKKIKNPIPSIYKRVRSYIDHHHTAILLALMLLTMGFMMFKPGITGYIVAGDYSTYSQDLNLTVTETGEYTLILEQYPELFTLTSMKLSGSTIGDGSFRIYLKNDKEEQFIIYYKEDLNSKLSAITGYVIEDIEKENKKESQRVEFNNICIETCALSELNQTTYILVFELDEGVELQINKVEYIVQELIKPEETPEELELAVSRDIDCVGCTQDTIPPSTEAEITIIATSPELIDNAVLTEIYPSEFTVTDAAGASASIYDESHYKLEWIIDEITNTISKTYTIKSPEKTGDYYFKTRLNEQDIEEWKLTVQPAEEIIGEEVIQPVVEEPTLDSQFTIKDSKRNNVKAEIKIKGKNVEIIFDNHPIKKIELRNVELTENATELIDVDDVPESGNFVEIYAIDPTNLNFTEATVTAIATGDSLHKCKDWNFEAQTCEGEWVWLMDIVPGEAYTFILTPDDPAFAETSEAVDVSIVPLDKNLFVVGWINASTSSVAFKVMDINSSIIYGPFNVAAGVNTASRVDISMINSTYVVISYYNNTVLDGLAYFSIHDITTGTRVFGPTRVNDVGKGGQNNDISVTQMGDRFVVCYANARNNQKDALFKIYYNNGTQAVAETQIHGSMGPQATLQNYLSCAATSATRWASYTYTGSPSDVEFKIFDEAGNELISQLVASDAGTAGQAALAAVDGDKFAMAWYSSTNGVPANTIQIAVYGVDGAQILAPTIIDSNAGTESRVSVAAIKPTEIAIVDWFIVTWWDQADSTLKGATYDGSGIEIAAPFNISTDQDETYRLIDVAGKDRITDNSFYGGRSIIAYTNVSNQGVYLGFDVNGVPWEGTESPDAFLNYPPANYYNNLTSFENIIFNCTASDDRGLENISLYITNSNNQSFALNQTTSIAGTLNTTTWTIGLSNGDYTWNCQVCDDDDLCAFSDANRTIKINFTDVSIPTITLNYPPDSYNTSINSINFNWTAIDDFDPILNCNLTIDGTVNASSISSPNGTPTDYTVLGFNDGAHYWNVTCLDNESNTNTSETRTFTIDTIGPTVTIVNPKNKTYNILSLTLDANFGQDAQTCWHNLNAGTNTTFTCGTTTGITANQGGNNIIVYANDSLGNVGSDTVQFSVDTNILLDISITYPANNSITNDPTPRIDLLAVDYSFSTIDYTIYIYYANGTLYSLGNSGTLINNTLTTISLNPQLNLIGNSTDYKIIVSANDTVNYDNSLELYLTLTEPAVYLVSPTNGYWDNDGNINFVFNYESQDFPTANCSLYINNVYNQNNVTTAANTNTTFIVAGIPEAQNQNWTVNCAMNGISIEDTYIFHVDKTSPSWSNNKTSSASGLTYSPSQTYQFNVTWSDTGVGLDTVLIEHNFTGTLQNYTVATSSGNEYYYNAGTLAAGNYVWKEYANDTTENQNMTDQWNYIINKVITFVNLSLNGAENNLTITYPTSVTAVYSTNTQTATVYRNGSDVSSENNTPITLAAGYYNYTVINPGNQNYTPSSKTFFATVNKSSSTCSLIFTPISPQVYGTPINASCSCTSPEANAILYRNGTDVTSTENNQLITLGAGDYDYNCTVSSTQNYTLAQNASTYTINKADHTIHLAINNSETNRSFVYPALTNVTGWLEIIQGAINAILYRNGASVDTGTPATEIDTLGVGTYNYTYVYPESQNYTAQSETRFLEINKSTTALTLTASPGWSVNNGTQTNISCYSDNSIVNINLYRNSTFIGSSIGGTISDVQTLALGNYNYTCNTTESQNYTAATVSNTLSVNLKDISYCSLTFSPVSGSTWPVSVTASCGCTNPEASAKLYKDGTDVTLTENGTATALAAGDYAYVCNVSETANYTIAINSSIYTINKAASSINLLLDGSDANIIVEVNSFVNITTYITTPISGAIEIYNNGTLINSGQSPLTNSTQFNLLGLYNITAVYPATQNYSSGYETHFITVQDTIPPSVINIQPDADSDYNQNDIVLINANVTDIVAVDTVKANITWSSGNEILTLTDANVDDVYEANFTNTGTVSRYNVTIIANDSSSNTNNSETIWFDILDSTVPAWSNNKTSPTSGLTYSPAQQYQFNVTWNDNIAIDTVLIEHNFTGTLQNYTVATKVSDEYYYDYSDLAAGSYVWRSYAKDTNNNWNYSDQWNYIVNKAATSTNLLLNSTDGDLTIQQTDIINITAISTPSGFIEIRENGTLIESGNSPLTKIKQYNTIGYYNITAIYVENQNYTSSFETHFINVTPIPDDSSPVVTLTAPANDSTDIDGNITFQYTVDDILSGVDNCSLIINSTLDQTDTSVTEAITQEFNKTFAIGDYTWNIICIDDSGNANIGSSETRLIHIITCTDNDNDTYSVEGGACGSIDCNDNNSAVNPGATEICGDGIDNDCTGGDESCTVPPSVGGGGRRSPAEPEEEIIEETIEPEFVEEITPEGEVIITKVLTEKQIQEIRRITKLDYSPIIQGISLGSGKLSIKLTNTGNKSIKNLSFEVEKPDVEKEAELLHPRRVWGWDSLNMLGWRLINQVRELRMLEWTVSEPKYYEVLRPGESIDVDLGIMTPLTKLAFVDLTFRIKSYGTIIYEETVPTEINTTQFLVLSDIHNDSNVVDMYMLVSNLEDEDKIYNIELNINTAPDPEYVATSSAVGLFTSMFQGPRTIVADYYGPFRIKAGTTELFAYQYEYTDEFKKDYYLKYMLFEDDEKIKTAAGFMNLTTG